jgi:uncharacterized protein (DUF2267 family)
MVEANIAKKISMFFDFCDEDNDGFLERNELGNVAAAMGNLCTDEEIDQMLADHDTDGDGKISKDEFMTWFSKVDMHTLKVGYGVKKSRYLQKSHENIKKIWQNSADMSATSMYGTNLSRELNKMPAKTTDDACDQAIEVLFEVAESKIKNEKDKEILDNLHAHI